MVKLSNKLNLKALVPIVSPDFPAWAFFTGPYGVCRILATLLSGLGGANSLSRLYFNGRATKALIRRINGGYCGRHGATWVAKRAGRLQRVDCEARIQTPLPRPPYNLFTDVLRSGSRKYLAAFHFHGRKEVFHHRKPALRLAGAHWTEIIIPCL